MCSHRASGRYGRIWTAWASAAIGSFAVIEVCGLITDGPDSTLSTYLRRRAGLLEPCVHSRLGRAAILCFSAWLAAHLGFGRLGFAPSRKQH